MDSRNTFQRNREDTRKANKYSAAALLALSFALAILSGGVFLASPTSITGMIFTAIGIISMLFCILFFVLYSHYLRRAEKEQ